MRLTRRGERVLIGAVLLGAALAGVSAQHWNPYTRHLDACRTYEVPEDTTGAGNPRAERLLAAGWSGRAGDHAERLYSPTCP